MPFNLHALRVFDAVVSAGGFSRAAAALRLSQPAVSRAVAVLEREVGVPLLERGARGIRLTEAGSALHDRARELFAVERTAEEELRALRGLERGVLRVGASTTIATYLLPPLLGAFQTRHPGVALRVASANTRTIARALLQRRLDVALVEGPVSDARLEGEPWREDELALIASPAHHLARGPRAITPASLAGEPFISRERGSGTREVGEAALAAHGVTPAVALTLASTEAVKQAVAAGLGLAIVSRAAAADQLALGRVVELRVCGLELRRAFTLLRLPGRTPSAVGRAFEELLREEGVG